MLSNTFRKANPEERRRLLRSLLAEHQSENQDAEIPLGSESQDLLTPSKTTSLFENDFALFEGFDNISNQFVENSHGSMRIPCGIVPNVLINQQFYQIPLATEEPSIIAAASYAAMLVNPYGGLSTASTDPIVSGQIYLTPNADTTIDTDNAIDRLNASRETLIHEFRQLASSLEHRGGGFRNLSIDTISDASTPQPYIRLTIEVDVRDAQGANIMNTILESGAPIVSTLLGGTLIMAIVSNAAEKRRSRAQFVIPADRLPMRGKFSGMLLAERIVSANRIAQIDRQRAVTHNKGIMNGISSLALATGNDTRSIEAAIHAWASHSGCYSALTQYDIKEDQLVGYLEVPSNFAVVGGATTHHPQAQLHLNLLGFPSASKLGEIAVAVGLLQNFAALMALVGEGIQKGHMKLHQKRQESIQP